MDKRMMDGTKILWHMDRVHDFFKKGMPVAPIHIDWGLSKFCNINCCFCFGKFQNLKREFIKRDALIRSIRDAGKIGVRSIAFIGDGEPTLNPYLYEALEVGKNNGISMAMSTSGIAIDSAEKCGTVLKNCEWMRFTLCAGDRDGYKKIHGVDKFDVLVKNISRMVKIKHARGYKCDIGLQAVYVPGLMDEDIVKEARLAVTLGVDYMVIKQCSLPENNKSVGRVSFGVDSYDSNRTRETLQKAQDLSTNKTQIIPKWKTIERKGKRLYDHCPAVPFISEISGNGDWFPCGYFFGDKRQYDKYKFGNIHDKGLKEIWQSERYWKIVDHFIKKFDSSKECYGSCRLDVCNKFVADYTNPPKAVNFV